MQKYPRFGVYHEVQELEPSSTVQVAEHGVPATAPITPASNPKTSVCEPIPVYHKSREMARSPRGPRARSPVRGLQLDIPWVMTIQDISKVDPAVQEEPLELSEFKAELTREVDTEFCEFNPIVQQPEASNPVEHLALWLNGGEVSAKTLRSRLLKRKGLFQLISINCSGLVSC